MIRVKTRQYGLFVGIILFSIVMVGQLALAADNKGNNPTSPELIITEASVDFDNDTLTIRGVNFDNGDTPVVTLGDDSTALTLISYTATEIVAELPAVPDGDYLLAASTGSSVREYDEYDLTIGAVGPQGDQGPQGKLGEPGADSTVPGPQGVQGKLGDQGPQGKLGDPGEPGFQGPQGKVGPQGDQGPQGKLGEPGADSTVPGPQGPQGKIGPEGPSGLNGAAGTRCPPATGLVVVGFNPDGSIICEPITPN